MAGSRFLAVKCTPNSKDMTSELRFFVIHNCCASAAQSNEFSGSTPSPPSVDVGFKVKFYQSFDDKITDKISL